MTISTYLADVWSATEFDDPDLSGYAESQMLRDTRIGVQTMALLSLVMQLIVAMSILQQGPNTSYIYTVAMLAILSVHILISAAFVDDIRALHILGMSFLTIGALAITFLAHQSGDLNIEMMAAIVMLFIAIPLVPWALREAAIIVGITYTLLTASLFSVPGRFAPDVLWVLQTLLFGSAVVVVVMAGRNTFIRKQDIRARFELEGAHEAMELLCMQDHLTGAWNRRYLDGHFADFADECLQNKEALHVAVLDIDDFKGINDRSGHQAGDLILISVAEAFNRYVAERGRVIRLGGDEFLVIYRGDGLDESLELAIADLKTASVASPTTANCLISLSAGIASTEPGHTNDLETLYRRADRALYAAKHCRPGTTDVCDALTRTGTWKL